MCRFFFQWRAKGLCGYSATKKGEKREGRNLCNSLCNLFQTPLHPRPTHALLAIFGNWKKRDRPSPSLFPKEKNVCSQVDIAQYLSLRAIRFEPPPPPPTTSPPDVTPFPIKTHLQKSFSIRASHTCVVERKGNSKTYFHLSFFRSSTQFQARVGE